MGKYLARVGSEGDQTLHHVPRRDASCTATRPHWPPTEDPGRDSTTSRSPPAPGCRGSTRSGSTQNSVTPGRVRSRLPSQISARRGVREPNRRASVKPRPVSFGNHSPPFDASASSIVFSPVQMARSWRRPIHETIGAREFRHAAQSDVPGPAHDCSRPFGLEGARPRFAWCQPWRPSQVW